MRNFHLNKKVFLHFIFIIIILLVVWASKDSYLTGFTTHQQLTLGLLVFAVYLWVIKPLPTGTSSILILALMPLLNLVDEFESALLGFLSPALYFIFMLSLISQALVKVGIDQVIARFLIKISKGGFRLIIVGLPVFVLLLPIVLPSAVARYKMLLPLMNSMNELYGFQQKSIFQKYGLFIIGMLNQNATMIIFTGGGFPILASQLLRDYRVTNIDWLEWFLIMAPPLWIGLLLMAIFVWNYLKLTGPKEELFLSVSMEHVKMNKNNEPASKEFWIVLISFLVMIVTWIMTDQQYFPLILPPMLLVVLYSLPPLGLITNKVIRDYDWENFLLLGTSFSLGILLEENGTAGVLARLLIDIIPADANTMLKVVIIAFIVFILRFFFIVPSSAIIVIFPIAMSYSELIGIPPIQLAFLVVMIVGSVMILPIHAPTTYLAYATKIFSKKDQYIIGLVSSVFLTFIAILATLFYW
jgi:solute carrier family 13 (sodium-dependent dicarboxylate transporter), member 2/3/5